MLQVLLGQHVLREGDLRLLNLGGHLRTHLVVRALSRCHLRIVRAHLIAEPHDLIRQLLSSLAEVVSLRGCLSQRIA